MELNTRELTRRFFVTSLLIGCITPQAFSQNALTWNEVKDKFEKVNPTLQAGRIGVDESKANEVTAYLRPNPSLNVAVDQLAFFSGNPYRPLSQVLETTSMNYLHERQHKRELRLESAQKGTGIAESQQNDLERTLLFNLRSAFVQTLLSKAVLENAKDNLEYWDRELAINQKRLDAGDIAQVDQQRLVLQRVQFESDYETALVNLRTSKVQLLMLLNDRTPIEQFDVTGSFDFAEKIPAQDDFRRIALDNRPDLRAAIQSVDKAVTDHQLAVANGSTDPTFGIDFGRNPPSLPAYMGFSVNFPLRIFDRNQGEKARTELDIHKNERQKDVAEAQVFSDVDSAYVTVLSTVNLLKPYKQTYLALAASVRDKVSLSYSNGAASLLDFLDAEKSYRDTRLAYLNLIGSYLTAAAQINLAVGREVL